MSTLKLLNSGHLCIVKNVSDIERRPLLGGNLNNILTFGTKHFVCYSWHVRYWDVSLYNIRLTKNNVL